MSAKIYYFSGTGNSLFIARKIADKLEDCKTVPIASLKKNPAYSIDAETAGFVFPMYFSGLPQIMHDFLNKTDFSKTKYIFVCYNLSGGPVAVTDIFKSHLKKKGKTLNALMKIKMPGNYIPMYDIINEEKQQALFNEAEIKINKLVDIIKNKENFIQKDTFLLKYLFKLIHQSFLNKVHNKDKNFIVSNKCISCGLCERICPVVNIILSKGKPKFLHSCEQCFACVHFCPVKAINYKNKTQKKKRYHHPGIKHTDIENEKIFSR